MSATSANRTQHLADDSRRQDRKLEQLEKRLQTLSSRLSDISRRLRELESK